MPNNTKAKAFSQKENTKKSGRGLRPRPDFLVFSSLEIT
jgi:hypothetical protein